MQYDTLTWYLRLRRAGEVVGVITMHLRVETSNEAIEFV